MALLTGGNSCRMLAFPLPAPFSLHPPQSHFANWHSQLHHKESSWEVWGNVEEGLRKPFQYPLQIAFPHMHLGGGAVKQQQLGGDRSKVKVICLEIRSSDPTSPLPPCELLKSSRALLYWSAKGMVLIPCKGLAGWVHPINQKLIATGALCRRVQFVSPHRHWMDGKFRSLEDEERTIVSQGTVLACTEGRL